MTSQEHQPLVMNLHWTVGGRPCPRAVTLVWRCAVGSRRKGGGRSDDGSFQLPPFLATGAVKPFIPEDLIAPLLNPIPYLAKKGGIAIGYEATLLPRICEVILDSAKAGPLRPRAQRMVDTAELLLRGFAVTGHQVLHVARPYDLASFVGPDDHSRASAGVS